MVNAREPNELYRNDGNGSFTKIAAAGGPGDTSSTARSTGAAWADMDADGDQDLIVVNAGAPNELYRNDSILCGCSAR